MLEVYICKPSFQLITPPAILPFKNLLTPLLSVCTHGSLSNMSCAELVTGNVMIMRATSSVYKHIHILIRGERFLMNVVISAATWATHSACAAFNTTSDPICRRTVLLIKKASSLIGCEGAGHDLSSCPIFCRLKIARVVFSCFQASFVLFQRILFAIANYVTPITTATWHHSS